MGCLADLASLLLYTLTHTKHTCPHGMSLHTWKWSHPKSNNHNIINRPLLLILACVQSCPTLCNPMDCSPPGSSSPWYFPGRNTEVGCHFFLKGIFLTQGSNSHLLSPTLAGRFFTTDPPGKLHQGLGVSVTDHLLCCNATQLVGSQFPYQGLNLDHGSKSPDS